ncbi:MAG: hypothetical protein APF76_14015 [Desulfitibacter sp. BRH_c19]|nr:MAG: hypothetical protein APF76_14015 [Desulfitibacter sp. BRH_c19]
MEKLEIDGIKIEYNVKRSERAKRMRITIKNGLVAVILPKGAIHQQAVDFLLAKKDWVIKHVQSSCKDFNQLPKRKYESGESYPYRGRNYMLQIENAPINKILIKAGVNVLIITIPYLLDISKRPEAIKEALLNWYKNQARIVFKEKLDYYSEIIGVEYASFRIKEQKTRWGSCSSKRNINLNWKVILAPNEVIDYIIVHELAHLSNMNHSTEFWELVAKYVPDYNSQKRWLKKNGISLSIE